MCEKGSCDLGPGVTFEFGNSELKCGFQAHMFLHFSVNETVALQIVKEYLVPNKIKVNQLDHCKSLLVFSFQSVHRRKKVLSIYAGLSHP